MVLHLPVANVDLKIYLANDLESGSSGFEIHLYDHRVTRHGCGRGCAVEKAEFKVHSQLSIQQSFFQQKTNTNYFIHYSIARQSTRQIKL
jgi:hypothetical protein